MNILDLTHWKAVQQAMLDLGFPATEESVSYGTPSFKIKKKFLLRLKEDGETMVIHSDDCDIHADLPSRPNGRSHLIKICPHLLVGH